jgi:hypothetical protein
LRLKEAEQFADSVVAVPWVAERQLFVDDVAIAAAVADLRQVARLPQLADDLRCGSFCDPEGVGYVAQACIRVSGDDLRGDIVEVESPETGTPLPESYHTAPALS